MRARFLALPFVLCIALATPGLAAADTTPGDGTYGGLDSVTVTTVTVNPRTGQAMAAGQVTCSSDFEWIQVSVYLTQVVGRFHTINGMGWAITECLASEGSASFQVAFFPDAGKFAPGLARVSADAYGQGACYEDPETGEYWCDEGYASYGPVTIRLTRTR